MAIEEHGSLRPSLVARSRGLIARLGVIDLGVVASQGSLLVCSLLTARALGRDGRGALALVSNWGQTIGWVAALSIDRGLLGQVHRSPEDRDVAAVRTLRGVTPVLLVSGAVAAIAFSVAMAAPLDDVRLVVCGAVIAAITPAWESVGSFLLASRLSTVYARMRVGYALWYFAAGVLVFAAGLVGAFGVDVRLVVVSVGIPTGLVVGVIVAGPALRDRLRAARAMRVEPRSWRPTLAAGARLHAAQSLDNLNSRLDILVAPLALGLGLSQGGVYVIGASIGKLAGFAGQGAYMATLADPDRPTPAWARWGVIGTAGAIVVGAPLLTVVVGDPFAGAVAVARLIAVATVLQFFHRQLHARFVARGRAVPATAAMVVAAGTFLVGVLVADTLVSMAAAALVSSGAGLLVAAAFAWLGDGAVASVAASPPPTIPPTRAPTSGDIGEGPL